MSVSISAATNSPVDLLHCGRGLTLYASLFFSVHSSLPAAAGLMIVLRLSIDKDIDRYQCPRT